VSDDVAWAQALCRKVGHPEIWFPPAGDDGREAKAVCATCPIRRECLAWALAHNEEHGIWGSTTARERARIRKANLGDDKIVVLTCEECFATFTHPRRQAGAGGYPRLCPSGECRQRAARRSSARRNARHRGHASIL
jgi:WhiB family redox-sensing transcriptional regulator